MDKKEVLKKELEITKEMMVPEGIFIEIMQQVVKLVECLVDFIDDEARGE